ncbi:response regulator [Lentzea aerocolonigenes]|uniref:response regulator n=1 Tax=Lentzea aerocolonigenes TaxID=68170 RepID=UPI000B230989|nr:response regulator transcription factor [Lentzea aerocolonigenes]MCP2248795.1 DNA-binding response regulator, NarL/FixJ family, contains REC and HTH domains [Lentzea aerocolonigenes]
MPDDDIRIVVADDHMLLREALCDVLLVEDDFAISGIAGDGEEVLAVSARTKPDVVLLDVEMPKHNPLRTVARLRELVPQPKIIILTMHDGADTIRRLLDAGVSAYLSKNVSRQHLVATIRSAHAGQSVVIATSSGLVGDPRATGSVPLSSRELEVLTLVATALSNRQIASRLSITEGTVKRHLRNIFEKLGVTSRMAAVRKAEEQALLTSDTRYL